MRGLKDGFLVECVLDTGQRLHSDPFGEFDLALAEQLVKDLRRRAMVETVYILRIATGEVVLEKWGWHRMPQPTLVKVSAPRDRILLPPPWIRS